MSLPAITLPSSRVQREMRRLDLGDSVSDLGHTDAREAILAMGLHPDCLDDILTIDGLNLVGHPLPFRRR